MTETLSGEVKRITYESEETGFRVVRVQVEQRGLLTVVGKFQFVSVGQHVRITGRTVADARHGEQFQVQTLVTVDPSTLAGIEKYLGSGLIPGIGPGFAKRIVAEFGVDTLRVLDEEPRRLDEVSGLGLSRRQEIVRRWREQRVLGNLTMLLSSHGITGQLARSIIERFGEKSAEIVQTNPYRLAMDVRGVGFKTADSIASSQGISRTHPDRVQAGTYHQLVLHTDQGHAFAPRPELVIKATEMLAVDEPHVESALDALWASQRIQVEQESVYLTQVYSAEVGVAAEVARLQRFIAPRLASLPEALSAFERKSGLSLATQQRAAVQACAEHKIVVITGGPGVGKTTLVRAILSVFGEAGLAVALAAPTGRAAKRLHEATGKRATTLHKLLDFEPAQRRFQRDRENPVDAQAVIIDEASMVDLSLSHALLSALSDPSRLVIVGDADQLPSVGAGAVLRDLIGSGEIYVVRLTQIFRQAEESRIVQSAHAILAGDEPAVPDVQDSDFFIIQRKEPTKAADTIVELVARRIPKRFGFDPRSDIQVLCPMHRGPVGTTHLNQLLQQQVNPPHSAKSAQRRPQLERLGQIYRLGDRVMQLRNDYDREVFNGDLGTVSAIEDESGELSVLFDDRSVKYSGAELEHLCLAYATSIHKSQGSEYPAVVIPVLTTHFVMLSRNLLYTAVTRAKKLCVLVADRRAIKLALSEVRRDERLTHLEERLRQALQT